MKKLLIIGIVAAGCFAYRIASNRGLTPEIVQKERLLQTELRRAGLQDRYLIISGYRPRWFNTLLPLSNKRRSTHMKGQAIDILVGDVNGDYRINRQDVQTVYRIINRLDRKRPDLRGGLGTYYNSSPLMIHFDVSGTTRRWNH